MGKYFKVEPGNNDIKVVIFQREDMDSNVFSEAVLYELNDVIDELNSESRLGGVVFISGHPNQFVAGADISEIERMKTAADATKGSEQMQAIFQKVADMKVPTVAAIHGACLGGGLEFALACTWRVITDDKATALGLPEIQLGLIPGAGGTQRLPRLIGLQKALDMILTGKKIKGKRAIKVGLADALVHRNQLREVALSFAEKKGRKHKGFALATAALEGNPVGRHVMHMKAKEMVEKNTKGFYPAPFRALEVIFKGIDGRLDKGLKLEARIFGELAMTRHSQSLIHLFHATTHIKKHPYKEAGKKVFGDKKVESVGIIGGGFMGAGIATVCADRKIRVSISDPNKEALGRALRGAKDYFSKKAKRKRIKRFEVDQNIAHITPCTSPQGFEKYDIVIEAVFEDVELKKKLLSQVEKDAGENWIFASNTSALPIKDIAQISARPERVLGMHFFSPVEKMPLLEVVVTEQTADWATARAVELGQNLGKQVIVVKDGPGFYTTRALSFFLNEAALMLGEGAKMDKIDKALTDFGFPVGPITLIDEVGIDVGSHVLNTMQSAFGDRVTVPEGMKIVLDTGRLGRKNGKGFYKYEDGKKGLPDEQIYTMLSTLKTEPKGIPQDEIVDRCLLLFVNESIRCLEEGVLLSAYDGDVGAVFGLGFPPFWGGPFRYVDHLGADTIVERLKGLADKYGKRFEPAQLLVDQAKGKGLFFPEEAGK